MNTRRHSGLSGKIGMSLLVAVVVLSFGPARTRSHAQFTITVSGTVTSQGSPVAGVRLWISSPQTWREAITNASGFYSVSIPTDGQLWFEVRPAPAEGLAQANLWRGDATTNVVQDFELREGILLEVRPTGGGSPVSGELQMEVQPLVHRLADNQWYGLDWFGGLQRYRAMLPPDVYYVTVHTPPPGYFDTTQAFDLRTTSVSADLPLNTRFVHPIPYEPPDATKISVGLPDGLGEATVTGAPGACLPLARVLLVNLNSTHQADAVAGADGSFSARIYAPPGSAIMVKHGPASPRWHDLETGLAEGVNPFPGTILNVSHTHTGSQYELPFAATGAIDLYADDTGFTRNYVGAAWALTGTIGPVYVDGEWARVLDGTYGGQAVPGLYLGGLNWTHPALGDLDGDDDLDLLVGEQSGHLVLYRNWGTMTSPGWRFETAEYTGVTSGWWAYPALADVTGDGALDLLVGTGEGTVAIYHNDGTPSTPVWPEEPDTILAAGGSPAPALTDLDGDVDLDLVVGHGGGTLVLYRNHGTPANPVWTKETDNYLGYDEGDWLQPSFVNLDEDADLDLLAGRCGSLVWYERGGSVAAPTWTRHEADPIGYGGGSCGNSPAVGDWNGDGLPDLAIGEHWGVLRFFRDDDVSGWSEQPFSFPFDLLGDSAPALADWDGDGDLDLLVGQAHGQLRRYRNDGSPASPDWIPEDPLPSLPWTNHPHAFPAFADVDGDNDYDLFVGEGGWQGPGAGGNIHYYRNDGNASAPDWVYVTNSFLGLDVGGWSTPVFADINDDGDLDLFVGDEAGTLTYVENTGAPPAPTWATPVQPYADLHLGEYSAPSFLDLDEDGDLDMLVGLAHGSLAYVRNTGSASNPAWELLATAYPGIDIGEQARPAAADLDGDDKPDLLLGDGDGGLNLYLYQGPGTPPGSGDSYLPGDLFRVEGRVRLYGPAISASTDVEGISVHPGMHLMKLFDGDGQPLPAKSYFLSSMLTPTGFPIQGGSRASIPLGGAVEVGDLHYAGGHAIEGNLGATAWLPEDLPPGIYRPTIWLGATGVPTNTDWLAANVVRTTFEPQEAALPPVTVGTVAPPRLNWRLLMDDFVQGTRGTAAREDQGSLEPASQIVFQGAPYYTPAVDARTGEAVTYRLEPFLPEISFTDRRMPTPPLLPFDLPSGQLCVQVEKPDGGRQDLGCEALAQSFNRTKTTRGGLDLNVGTVQMEDVYSLKAASDRFRVTFDQYGHHIVTMNGVIYDLWGNGYNGGGTYDVWVAQPLDIDPGVLPGTPLAVGDAFDAALQIYPRVPAQVELAVSVYPDSDPARKVVHTVTGTANPYGYFDGGEASIGLTEPGEYRVDLTAVYTETSGELFMGSMTWGGVVMTPDDDAELVAHGRRGLDSLQYIPNFWFVSSDLDIPQGAVSHSLNPYYNGDVLWTRMSDGPYGGDSLVLGASVQDPVGEVEAAIEARYLRARPSLYAPGSFQERVDVGELPLFISTRSGWPAAVVPEDVDQIAYSYRSSQRPGVRVREVVAEDGESGGYWRLDTLYDDQLGVGIQGDQVNDYKFQYIGAVYRDLDTGRNEYLGQGTGWIFIPDDDPVGSRAMPPFAGYGGWDPRGGPLLTLKGQEIHIFLLPTGTRPGALLEVGDAFRFAGHLMPTLNSQVAVTVTAPSGLEYQVDGQANSIGYFYDPVDDLIVNEPGLWSVDVRVWHEGQCSGGTVNCAYNPSLPCPSGDVLGSDEGRTWFYVVPAGSSRLDVSTPAPGFLAFDGDVTPVTISGRIPAGLTTAVVDYTIGMSGFVLEQGEVTPSGGRYQVVFDPVALHENYPNLDLEGRDSWGPGLADTFAIGLLLRGDRGAQKVYQGNMVTIQGEQVFVHNTPWMPEHEVFLPLVLKGGGRR